MDSKIKKKLFGRTFTLFLFTVPVVFMYTVFFLITMLVGVYYSFTNWNGISKSYNFVGFQNYIKALHTTRFISALRFNFLYTFLFVIILIVISLIIAVCLHNLLKAKTIFRSIYFMPAVLSMVTVGLIWNELFYRVFPIIGKTLNIGWLSNSLLGNKNTAMFAILLVNLWQGCSIPIVLFLAGLQSVPTELYEAAIVDGARAWDKFKNITIPFLIPVLNIVIITQVKGGLTIFDYIKAMTDGGPGGATEAVGLLIYNHAIKESAYSLSVAEAMILFLIVAVVAALTIKTTNNKQVGD